jgi:hypothetical protein
MFMGPAAGYCFPYNLKIISSYFSSQAALLSACQLFADAAILFLIQVSIYPDC